MDLWILYLVSISEQLAVAFIGFGTLGVGIGILATLYFNSEGRHLNPDDKHDAAMLKTIHTFRRLVPIGLVFVTLGILIPPPRAIYTTIGVYVVTNIDGIENLPPNLVKAANKFLEDYTSSEKTKK